MQELDYIIEKHSLKNDIATIVVSLLLTVLIHVTLLESIPAKFDFKSEKSQQMKIEILPPKLLQKTPSFVEANPYGNELKPKKEAPTSFKNQQVADELPEKNSTSTRPFVKGEDKKYKKILSGTNDKSDILNPSLVPQVLERPLQEHSRQTKTDLENKSSKTQTEQNSKLSQSETKNEQIIKTNSSHKAPPSKNNNDIVKLIAKTEKIDAVSVAKNQDAILIPVKESQKTSSKKIEREIKVEVKAKAIEKQPPKQSTIVSKVAEIPTPRPRPRLSMKIPAGPLLDNNKASSNAGVVSVDSRFSEFGAYQQRMIEAISRQWNLLGSKYDLSSSYGTQVLIEFSLNTEGELVSFKIVFSTSTHTGSGLCEQAILSTAPYGIWTQEMVNTLGTQPQKVRINFIYR